MPTPQLTRVVVLLFVVVGAGCDGCRPVPNPPAAAPTTEPGPVPGTSPGPDQRPAPGRGAGPARVFAVLVSGPPAHPGGELDPRRGAPAVRALLASGLGRDRLVLTDLAGETANPAQLARTIRELPISGDDALVCYVTGVGGHAGPSADGFTFHFTGPSGPQSLNRSDLRMQLLARGARLTVLLSDTAAGAPTGPAWPPPLRGAPAGPGPGAPLADAGGASPGFRALFLTATGTVDWAGAEEGTSGWGPPDETGFFTRAIVKALHDLRDNGSASWSGVYSRVKPLTERGYEQWRAGELLRLRGVADPTPDERAALRLLAAQERLSSRAYHLPGTALRMITRDSAGGVEIAELPLDSPCRTAGLRAGELVLAVNGQRCGTVREWNERAGGPIRDGATNLTFRIRGGDGRERDVTVPLAR